MITIPMPSLKPPFLKVTKIDNLKEEKRFKVILAPRIGNVILFEGEEYDAIEEFTEELIVDKVKQLYG